MIKTIRWVRNIWQTKPTNRKSTSIRSIKGLSSVGFKSIVKVVKFWYIYHTSVFWIKGSTNFIHIWIDIIIVKNFFIQTLWTVEKDRLFTNKDKIWALHHIGCTIIVEVQISNFLPVCVIIIDSLVETDKTFFLQILSTDNRVVLSFEVKNLWIAKVISCISRLINQNFVNFFNLSILIH